MAVWASSDSIARGVSSLRRLSDAELEDEREALRQQYVSSQDIDEASRLYDELDQYDDEMTRRANEAYDRENPNPPELGTASMGGTCLTTTN